MEYSINNGSEGFLGSTSQVEPWVEQNSITKKEEEILKSENNQGSQSLKCLQCKSCDFLSYSQTHLDLHLCTVTSKFNCPGNCGNKFSTNESFRSHLMHDHMVRSDEVEFFINSLASEKSAQKIHIVDYQLLKKPDTVNLTVNSNQPKSKIFIKDVTLLRKPDLPPNDIAIPNIFDSLDLTTHDDDITFDDLLGPDDQIFDDDFDFDESANLNNVETFPTPEPIVGVDCSEVEIVLPDEANNDQLSGKISVRKNLCNGEVSGEAEGENIEVTTSKIFVRSHESLTCQVITTESEQPSEASTPDCIIVSSDTTPTSKIFIRNIETLTNPDNGQFYSSVDTTSSENFINLPSNYPPPTIFVRSYDSLANDARPEQPTECLEMFQPPQQRCKISIKNMNTLIEPRPCDSFGPLIPSMIFGQAQNLVIHMRPNQDESLLGYRDTSMTPDTLPGSSNVSVCGGNDDVIVLDDSEMTDTIFSSFTGSSEIQNDVAEASDASIFLPESLVSSDFHSEAMESSNNFLRQTENSLPIDNPERNETPNEKTVLQKLELSMETIQSNEEPPNHEDQPMVRIPIDFTESPKEPERKKVKIIKIIRVKKKNKDPVPSQQLNNIQIIFKCSQDQCNQHFSTEQLLKYHKKCHGANSIIICPECSSEEFKNFNTLHTHLWRSHKVDMELFACQLCDFKTPILSRLKNFHAKIHSVERNFKCSVANCGKSFKNSKQLKNHSQIHKTKKKVKVKMKIISEDADTPKRIRCGECNKGFSSESGLYIHSMEHKTDEKKFNCEECEYSTNDHNSFRRHKSQHSQVHQYKCSACEYTSIQSHTYRKHLEKQHPELAESLLFKCTECKFTTISKGKYEGHMLRHKTEGQGGRKSGTKIKVKNNLRLTDPPIYSGVLMNLQPT